MAYGLKASSRDPLKLHLYVYLHPYKDIYKAPFDQKDTKTVRQTDEKRTREKKKRQEKKRYKRKEKATN